MTTTTTTAPQVYVADLGAYVAGCLRGKWFTPTDYEDADEFAAAVAKYIAERPGAEEYAFHDYDGFGKLNLGEYEGLDRVFELASAIAEHGQAFIDYAWNEGLDYAEVSSFEEALCGQYESGADYAQEFYEDTDGGAIAKLPDTLKYRIDWEGVWRDMSDGYTISEHGYVFRTV